VNPAFQFVPVPSPVSPIQSQADKRRAAHAAAADGGVGVSQSVRGSVVQQHFRELREHTALTHSGTFDVTASVEQEALRNLKSLRAGM
jgi:hypothetical protein